MQLSRRKFLTVACFAVVTAFMFKKTHNTINRESEFSMETEFFDYDGWQLTDVDIKFLKNAN
tara:strand:+ start:49 stop:234 length:186 start_codon:yes stop_codon:yes gene_type:complete